MIAIVPNKYSEGSCRDDCHDDDDDDDDYYSNSVDYQRE